MKKSDLKNGMIVECRNGKKYLVVKDFEVYGHTHDGIFWGYYNLCSHVGYNCFDEYDDNLLVTDHTINEYGIMKIYYIDYVPSNELLLLWERKEVKLTDDERKLLEVLYNQGLRWMVRDCNASISFFKEKPTNEEGHWDTRFDSFYTATNMFSFIAEEDYGVWDIKELLEENKTVEKSN